MRMTSEQVWKTYESVVTGLVRDGRSRGGVVSTSVSIPDGSIILSAATHQHGVEGRPTYVVEWLGPWDNYGVIWLDDQYHFAGPHVEVGLHRDVHRRASSYSARPHG